MSVATWADQPIPALRGVDDWRRVPIIASSEPLVQLAASEGLRCDPQYWQQQRPGALPALWVRQAVALRLTQAAASLASANLGLLVWDAWRPLSVQQSLYDEFASQLQQAHPEWDAARLASETQVFVSLPSSNQRHPSPHYTGGAVDLTLMTLDGQPLPLGTDFDAFTPAAATGFLEQHDHASAACRHRRILFHALAAVGFTNYPDEWWHFDYGNQFWGRISGQSARYGPANLP